METITKEDLGQNQPRKRRLTGCGQFDAKKRAVFVIGVMILVLLGGVWFNKNSTAYAVFVNGKETLVFENEALATQAVQDFLEKKSQEIGKTVTTKDNIEVRKVKINKTDQVLAADGSQMLEQQLNMLVPGAAIVINGVEKAVVTDQKTAESLIDKIKNTYTPTGDNWKVVKVELKEKVQIVEKDVPMEEIINVDQAFQLLTVGSEKMETHIVEQGESLWSIAKDNNLKMEDLEEANPEYNPDKLQIGDEIKLVKMDPMVHVTTVAEFTEVKNVPYGVEVESDSNMLRGKEKVKQAGKDGSKEFKYLLVQENGHEVDKQFLEGTVLTKPVNKVVVKGTKLVLASRSSGGSGDLRWPIRGSITSRFGYRGREFHTGLDIDGDTGDPVYAAEAGTVVYIGRDGNYGKVIRISHGSGIQTWYAHLSAYEVSSGTKVDRGDLIGRVGNTGRSTGSHLHFEVRVNGNPVNPLNYLD
ncbi:MAG: M23 family metallopeptidase [Dehalobacterium sp.]